MIVEPQWWGVWRDLHTFDYRGCSGASADMSFTGVGTLRLVSIFKVRSFSAFALLAGAALAMTSCSSESAQAPLAPADRLEFRGGPVQAVAGVPVDPAVQVLVLRADGSIDGTSTAAVSLTSQSATIVDTLRGGTTVVAVAGVATFTAVSLSRASDATRLVARTAGLTGAESAPIRVVHGEATQLVILAQPASAVAGQTLSPLRVQLRDVGGNRVMSANGPVTVAISTGPLGATLAGTVAADLAAGEASFNDIRLPRAGSGYTLTVSLVGNASVRSPVTRVFSTVSAAPVDLVFLTEPTASTVGFSITPAVRVAILDGFGNIVAASTPPVALELAVAATGTQLTGATAVTPGAGIATFANLRVDRPSGTVRLRASAPGLNPAISAGFTVGAP